MEPVCADLSTARACCSRASSESTSRAAASSCNTQSSVLSPLEKLRFLAVPMLSWDGEAGILLDFGVFLNEEVRDGGAEPDFVVSFSGVPSLFFKRARTRCSRAISESTSRTAASSCDTALPAMSELLRLGKPRFMAASKLPKLPRGGGAGTVLAVCVSCLLELLLALRCMPESCSLNPLPRIAVILGVVLCKICSSVSVSFNRSSSQIILMSLPENCNGSFRGGIGEAEGPMPPSTSTSLSRLGSMAFFFFFFFPFFLFLASFLMVCVDFNESSSRFVRGHDVALSSPGAGELGGVSPAVSGVDRWLFRRS